VAELKGDALCQEWLRLVALLYGQECADKSIATCDRGWYCLVLSIQCEDGSIATPWKLGRDKRHKAALDAVETLRRRIDEH